MEQMISLKKIVLKKKKVLKETEWNVPVPFMPAPQRLVKDSQCPHLSGTL